MRIIIAGGSGLIGRELTSALVAAGNEVTILSRNPNKPSVMPDGVKLVQWDGKNIHGWAEQILDTNVVINLAGENLSGDGLFPSRWTKERKERLLNSRVNAGMALTKAIEIMDKKPETFIQASGIGIYGTQRGKLFTEESEIGNDFLANLSIQWEAASQSVEKQGVRRVVLRTGVVLCQKSHALRLLLLPYKLFIGGPIGDGKQVYSWIHMDDAVNAIIFLLQNDHLAGVFNLTAPHPVTSSEFGETISMVLKRPHYLPLPSFAMRLAFGEVASMVLEGQKVIPKRILEEGFNFRYPTLDKALIDILGK